MHKLFLQRDRARRKHDFLPAANGRDQIRERFSDPGARFDDRVHPFQDAALDELRHLQLPGTRLVARQRSGKRSGRTENGLQVIGH